MAKNLLLQRPSERFRPSFRELIRRNTTLGVCRSGGDPYERDCYHLFEDGDVEWNSSVKKLAV